MSELLKESLKIEWWQIGLAFCLDLLIGDPRWLPHPVRIMGFFIRTLESFLRSFLKGAFFERIGGILLVIFMVCSTFFVSCFMVWFLERLMVSGSFVRSAIGFSFFILILSTTLATKGLLMSCLEVINHLREGHLYRARKSLSMIVGRDTEDLQEEGVIRATLETLSENLCDGVVAPLFYLAIGGLPLAMTYKAINTMDSMVGYKNQRYRYFGWASARLDDIANYIPARLSAGFIIIAIFFIETSKGIYQIFDRLILNSSNGSNSSNSFKKPESLRRFIVLTIFMVYDFILLLRDAFYRGYLFSKRALLTTIIDGKNSPSPNSGYPEAALAGALGIRLGGPVSYGGVEVHKPYIGISVNPLNIEIAREGILAVALSAILAGVSAVVVRL